MPLLEIQRRNCVGGVWGIPDSDPNAKVWVPLNEVVDYHLELAGHHVVFDRLRPVSMKFTPDDPSDTGGEGVPGTLSIEW